MGEAMLELAGARKVFNPGTPDQKQALDGLDLSLPPGQFVTVIGSNGAGKSTLLNCIAGTHALDGGRVVIAGRDVSREPEHRRARYLARVFQDPTLGTAASMTIEENLSLAELRGGRRGLGRGVTPARRRRYAEVLASLGLGLEDRLRDRAGLLSGGQRQSLALLMATLSLPRLLLLDEHTAALDPRTAEKVMALTAEVVATGRLTTLMVTHNMNQALEHGDRMIMLHRGRVRLDVAGADKASLTVPEVVAKFGSELKDETLLSAGS